MYFRSILLVLASVCPLKNKPSLFRFLATSSGPCPENSIHVLLKSAQAKLRNELTSDYKDDVDDSMDGIAEHFDEIPGRREEVNEPSDRYGLPTVDLLPIAEQLDKGTAAEAAVQHLTEEV